jgi:hypothetical protein
MTNLNLNLDIAVRVKPLNKPTDQVILRVGDHTLHVAAVSIARAIVEPIILRNGHAVATPLASASATPKIGEVWKGEGGAYASVGRNEDGREFKLVVGPESPKELPWGDQCDWARSIEVDGHKDFQLPTRRAGALAYATVPELFQKKAYWLVEQAAGNASYAWCQDFSYGHQCSYDKDDKLLGRAVRMIFI